VGQRTGGLGYKLLGTFINTKHSNHIEGKSTATLEDNDIHSNTGPGVRVTGEGFQALLKSNHIHDGKNAGV
jgi:hypothetical protein